MPGLAGKYIPYCYSPLSCSLIRAMCRNREAIQSSVVDIMLRHPRPLRGPSAGKQASNRRSRRSCSNCQVRNVKCDKKKPSCTNCFLRMDSCLYPQSSHSSRARLAGNHRGSRRSCSVCKVRKIKCDKKRPSCTNCHLMLRTCLYPQSSHHSSPTQPAGDAAGIASDESHQNNPFRVPKKRKAEDAGTETCVKKAKRVEEVQKKYTGEATHQNNPFKAPTKRKAEGAGTETSVKRAKRN